MKGKTMKKLIALLTALAFAGTACATTINFNSGSAAPRHKVVKTVKKDAKHARHHAEHRAHHQVRHHAPVRFHR